MQGRDGANYVEVIKAIPAGTNNIGNVDIASAIPAGTNIIGQVGIDQTTPGTTNGVVINGSLGKLAEVTDDNELKVYESNPAAERTATAILHNATVGAGDTVQTSSIDCRRYGIKTVCMTWTDSTDVSATVQVSPNDVEWYDSDVSWSNLAAPTSGYAKGITLAANYLRLSIVNNGVNAATNMLVTFMGKEA